MRALVLLAVLSLLALAGASAQNAPAKIDIKDAASLIGKSLDDDTQYATGSDAQRPTSGDWTYGFEFDDPGLQRTASTKERGKAEALLATVFLYNKRCNRSDRAVSFSFGGDERFALKGNAGKRRADAWLYLGNAASFESKPAKLSMAFSENDGALHFKLDPAQLARNAQLALCPTTAAPEKSGRCMVFSLAGFARAYDFVCDAK